MKANEARGILAIWHDMVPEHEQAVNDWYNHEHHRERMEMPGFFSARRHVALQGEPKYFVFYETTDPSVLDSETYLAGVNNPSPWTQRSMPHYRNTNRLVCTRQAYLGVGHGACVMTLRFATSNPAGMASNAEMQKRTEALLQEPGIASLQIWQLDAARTHLPTKEKEIRGEPDGAADGVILLTGNYPEQVRAAAQKHLDAQELVNAELFDKAPDVGLYQLIFTMGG